MVFMQWNVAFYIKANPSLTETFPILKDTRPITVLIYETEAVSESPALHLFNQISRLKGINAFIFGSGQGFEGYGSKYTSVYPVLRNLPANHLVVLSDGRDVLLNNPAWSDYYARSAARDFQTAFQKLTKNRNAVVISAEAQCCVSALTHAQPGSYYNPDGSRKERACSSGEMSCLWAGDEKAMPWESFMKDLAIERTNQNYDDVYLNAGLMVGTAQDLMQLIDRAGIGNDEDDQAVLTDFMYHNPEAIVLDYGQTLFGNNRGGIDDVTNVDTCMFALLDDAKPLQRLYHTKTQTSPLFVHSPGGYLECHDKLAKQLGYRAVAVKSRRLFQKSIVDGRWVGDKTGCNYARICLGKGTGFLGLGFGYDKPRFGS
jgi:hypothetical protein